MLRLIEVFGRVFARRRIATANVAARALSVNDRSHDHGNVQQDPTDAWQVDVFVPLLYPEPKPENGCGEIRAPRHYRNSRRLLANPYGQNLWNRHDHSEDRHASHYATQNCVGAGGMNRSGHWIWMHSFLQGQIITPAYGYHFSSS
jgi:hypothetical protein